MPIYVAASLMPRNGGTWSLIEDKYLRGGFQVSSTQAIRDAIDSMNRKSGMLVLTLDDHKLYSLQPDLVTWAEFTVTPSAHTHAAADVTTAPGNQFVTNTQITTWDSKQDALGFTPVDSTTVGQASGIASLDVGGKLSASQIPDITITDTYVVADQVSMLAIDCQVGDVCVRTDLSKSFILKVAGASTLGNWQELLSPTTGVVSVSVTAPIQNSGSAGSPVIGIAVATTSNPGTMSAADKTKLDGIASGANIYVHPTTDGTLHVPATGTTNAGKVLTAGDSSGSIAWSLPAAGITAITVTAPVASSGGLAPTLSMAAATASTNGYMTQTYAAKLDGISAGATANLGTVTNVGATAPVTSTGGTTPSISMAPATSIADGYMTSGYALKLDGIASSANNYAHPTGDGNLHVPATSTTNSGKVLTAGATAGSLSWTTAAGGTITSVTATAPVTSSGGNAPVIAMPAATSAVDGYLKAVDWVLFNSKGAGNVLTVSGTAPVVSSGGTAPVISMAAATGSVPGYLTAADWTTFNGKQAALGFTPYNSTNPSSYITAAGAPVQSVGVTAPVANSGTASAPVINMAAATAVVDGYLKATDWVIFNSKGTGTGTVTSVSGSGAISVATGTTTPVVSIAAATTLVPGTMSAADKTKLDGVASGATANLGTVTSVTGNAPIVSTGGSTPAISITTATALVDGYMTSVYASKLDGIAANANNYVHPTGDGNLHVPATSTTNNGKVLTAGATAGSLSWTTAAGGTITSVTATGPVTSTGGNAPVIAMPAATSAVDGYLKSTDWVLFNSKGSGNVLTVSGTAPVVSSGGTTPAISMAAATSVANGYMTSTYAAKLDGIASGATNYAHPTGDGNLHVPATSTTNNGKVLTAGATAGSLSWTSTSVGTVTSVSGTGSISITNPTTTPSIAIANATTGADGAMSSADKTKLDGIAASANNYALPTASAVALGGIKVGAGLAIDGAGVLSASGGSGTVTGVTATSPVTSSGGTAPVISMAAATSILDGYLKATDWVLFNSKGPGSVTSVSGAGSPNGLTLTGTVTGAGSLTLGGSVTSVATTGNFQMNSLGIGTPGSGTAGEIRATGDVTAFYSDARLKNVSGNIQDALAKVMSLNGVVYTNNDVAKAFGYHSDAEQVGVLAQEVDAVLPQVVTAAPFDIGRDEATGQEFSKSGQDYMTVRYERIIPLLIEAIKELTAKVAVLEGK